MIFYSNCYSIHGSLENNCAQLKYECVALSAVCIEWHWYILCKHHEPWQWHIFLGLFLYVSNLIRRNSILVWIVRRRLNVYISLWAMCLGIYGLFFLSLSIFQIHQRLCLSAAKFCSVIIRVNCSSLYLQQIR